MGRRKVCKTKAAKVKSNAARTLPYLADPGSRDVAWGGIRELWEQQQLCDVVLKAETACFPVHRCYLASCSPYFSSMFTGTFVEASKEQVEINGITAAGLEAALKYMYTGVMEIGENNISDTLEACALLQLLDAQKLCGEYVKEELSATNCLQFLKLAELYTLEDIKNEIMKFILSEFVPVSLQQDFLQMSLDLLCELLDHDSLHAHSELRVFEAAVRWLDHQNDRHCHAEQVMSRIRFGLMTKEEMDQVNENEILHHPACRTLLRVAIKFHMDVFGQVKINSSITQPPSSVRALICFGGRLPSTTLSNEIHASPITDTEIGNFVSIGHLKKRLYNMQVAVVNNFVFVVGGQTTYNSKGEHATYSTFRYNPRDRKWLQLASLNTPRCRFALMALADCMFAVGGVNDKGGFTSSVEKYSFSENEWSEMSKLSSSRGDLAGCVQSGCLYMSGGWSNNTISNEMMCYDEAEDTWQTKSPMVTDRCWHTMVSLGDQGDKIFVFGGATKMAGSHTNVMQSEIYDVKTNQWSQVAPIVHGASFASAVVYNHSIFLLGGYDYTTKNMLDVIQRYNIDMDKWETLDTKLPYKTDSPGAACVKLCQIHEV